MNAMKNIITLCFLTLAWSIAIAQNGQSTMSVAFGVAIPTSDFASTDIDNPNPGWANTGLYTDLSFEYFWGDHGQFGIETIFRNQVNSVDVSAMANAFALALPGNTILAESGSWDIEAGLIGTCYKFKLGDRSTFCPRALLGFYTVTLPNITITTTSGNTNAWFTQLSSISTSFAYLFGGNYSFGLGNSWLISASIDYTGTNPKFSDVRTYVSDGNVYTDTWRQNISTLSAGIGLSLEF